MPRFILLIITLLFGSAAHAEYYYWYMSYFDKKVSSPTAGCDLYFSSISDKSGLSFAMEPSPNDPGKTFYCVARAVSTGRAIFTTDVYLKGDRCPEGTEFDKETGECKENKCKILAGSLYEKGGHQAPISRFINYLGCEIAVSSIDGCIGPAEGEAGGTFCRVIGSFTGNWFTSKGSCAFGCDVGPGDGPPPGGDGGDNGGGNPPGGDGGTNPPGGDGGSNPPGGDGGGGGGGGGGGNNPCQGHVGSDCGSTGGDGNGGDGSGSGGSGGGSDGDGGGKGEGLKRPKQGSFDKPIEEWSKKVIESQGDFKELSEKFKSSLKNVFDIRLSSGGGSLPCKTISALGMSYSFCLEDYRDSLSQVAIALQLMALIISAFIVMRD
ncbi:coat protein A [Pseudomonas aeruginosa]|nr:coat protein A [Pseudomonas aeruginosa]